MATRSRFPHSSARRSVARAALLALLLQLVVPLLGLGQLSAKGIGDAPFVICTGAGLVWIDPEGTPVEEHEETHPSCPVCALGKFAASAVLPMAPALTLPAALVTRLAPPGRAVSLALRTAPPLPARGPPRVT
jgi:hypothetical protein